jgi:hypothetical protein
MQMKDTVSDWWPTAKFSRELGFFLHYQDICVFICVVALFFLKDFRNHSQNFISYDFYHIVFRYHFVGGGLMLTPACFGIQSWELNWE